MANKPDSIPSLIFIPAEEKVIPLIEITNYSVMTMVSKMNWKFRKLKELNQGHLECSGRSGMMNKC